MTERITVRVLLIEDHPEMADLVAAMLSIDSRHDFRLTHVGSLSEGLHHFKDQDQNYQPFDIILLDLNLPDSQGYQTFERIIQAAPALPLVLMTNLDDESLALRCVRNGAQDYLAKTELDAPLLSRAIMYALERKRVEEALRESQDRFTLAMRGANDGIWDWNLCSNQIYFSPRWKSILGFCESEISDRPDEWLKRIHPLDFEHVRTALSAHLHGASAHFMTEHRMQRKDGEYIWVLVRGLAVRDSHGKATRMAGSLSDITVRKRTEEQLLHDAFHDSLTGLPNRSLFLDRLERLFEQFKRQPTNRFSVLFLDLDRFKVINDSLGHTIGDQVLQLIAGKLSGCLRAGDTVARIGGDEFAILLQETDTIDDALVISDRIQEALQEPISINEHHLVTSASIGIVLSDIQYNLPEDILRDADIAMYRAKMLGKACHAVFNPAMRHRALIRMGLENDLRDVLANQDRLGKEFNLVFQPIVSLQSGKIAGFEALLRWDHPQRGAIAPSEFIPIAEETGLIHWIGLWVLREACRQASDWRHQRNGSQDARQVAVNVNISGVQFSRPGLVQQIKETLHEFSLPASSLNLEITESLLVEREEPFFQIMDQLCALGVNLQVDDFGRGYSSYGYLQSLPIKTLKIDAAFIGRLGVKGNNSEIVRSIVSLARSLGISVIAEGVETADQYHRLRELECPFAQGYYVSRPVAGSQVRELLSRNWLISPAGSPA